MTKRLDVGFPLVGVELRKTLFKKELFESTLSVKKQSPLSPALKCTKNKNMITHRNITLPLIVTIVFA